MSYKRLNMLEAMLILGVNFDELMDLLAISRDEKDLLERRIFIAINPDRYGLHAVGRLEAMRGLITVVKKTFKFPRNAERIARWFHSKNVSLVANYYEHKPIRVIQRKGAVGIQMIRGMFVRALQADTKNLK